MGHMEIVPSASAAERFLALEQRVGEQEPYGVSQAFAAGRAHQTAIQNLGGQALNELRAQWPVTLQNIRQDLQVFQLSTDPSPSIVGSFLFQDQMEVGPAPDPSYSLLVLGEPQGNRFNRTFTWYRRVEEEGKGSPRYFSKMDWDGDGQEELLLEVYGADSRWWAALDKEGGGWSVAFQDPCGEPEAS
jgi:hypothetical protein